MDFATRLVLVLIVIGLFTLMYIIGCIMEALTTYIKHTKERRARERRHNSPMANNRKGGYRYGRTHD